MALCAVLEFDTFPLPAGIQHIPPLDPAPRNSSRLETPRQPLNMPSPISSLTAQTVNFILGGFTFTILLLRLFASRFQPRGLDASFYLTLFSILVLTCRTMTTYFTLHLDTAADAILASETNHPFTTAQLSTVKTGTLFSLSNRALETTFWWTQSTVLLLLYRRLVSHLPWAHYAIILTWSLLATTYAAVLLAIFFECRPFWTYYQVSPDPGSCVRANVQTLIQCLSNIAIDVALTSVAVPLMFVRVHKTVQRVRIGALIALGLCCTVITCVRLAYIYAQGSLQATRSFWGGVQILVSGIVANAPVVYGSTKLWWRKGGRPGACEEAEGDQRTLWGGRTDAPPEEDVVWGGKDKGTPRLDMVSVTRSFAAVRGKGSDASTAQLA
ncbi:hypothetical protein CAC42_3422 [Sphaceloma murrayae]|uniref:Rhodopsin domain-containing protein n=1 Tax=Sphaceloma murrayae TaxID=2082308 RepID=A0A2K1R1B2_9PEZI|nr:hypothetical protein CAC42_3422 [Sphaceloma murrayae]